MPALVALDVHADPVRWRGAGFEVDADGGCRVGAVRLRLVAPPPGERGAVAGWAFEGLVTPDHEIDGIPTAGGTRPAGAPPAHPNGAISVDHVVVTTPDVGRTIAALERCGLEARRERATVVGGRSMRQVFLRPGEAIIEVVGPAEPGGDGRARFFGLTFTVGDLASTAALLGDDLGQAKDAVQPGRRIATVRASAGLGVPVALMSPDPAGRPARQPSSDGSPSSVPPAAGSSVA